MLTVEGKKFDWKNIPLIQCADGNAKDTYATAKVYAKLLDEVRQKKLEKLYEKLIAPLTVAFFNMEYEGLLIDEDKMNELDVQLQEKIKLADTALREAAGLEDGANLNSTSQLVKIIYSFEKDEKGEWIQVEDFGLGLYPFEFTKKGAPSTNEETLSKVKSMVEEEFTARGLKIE
jgi:DNA polymerase I-like protein with 3'-5' exonuclease and polymerase domains|tara:strand:+ start:528 stop:1052 length:525 start_codon:yes stop_codon:yes gene_type:complete